MYKDANAELRTIINMAQTPALHRNALLCEDNPACKVLSVKTSNRNRHGQVNSTPTRDTGLWSKMKITLCDIRAVAALLNKARAKRLSRE